MLNKELFGGIDKDYPYTHIITVGKYQYGSTYGMSIVAVIPYGKIEPNTFADNIISTLVQTSLNAINLSLANGPTVDTDIYLARSDNGYNLGTHAKRNSGQKNSFYWTSQYFFTLADVGKEIPIWLSTEPPP